MGSLVGPSVSVFFFMGEDEGEAGSPSRTAKLESVLSMGARVCITCIRLCFLVSRNFVQICEAGAAYYFVWSSGCAV